MTISFEDPRDAQVRKMYTSAPYPFVSLADFNAFRSAFLQDLAGVADLIDFKGKSVLDAGCGTGEKASILAEWASEVVGVDASPESLKHARHTATSLGRSNIEFIEDSLLSLERIPADKRFDIVFCSGVLHHLSDPYRGFQNIVARLKPGGLLIISLYHPLGLLGYKIRYSILGLLAGRDEDARYRWARRLFYRHVDVGNQQVRSKIFDTYVHPQIGFFSVSFILQHWFHPNDISIENVHAKYSTLKFMFKGARHIRARTLLVDCWFGVRRKGFVYMSGRSK